MADLFRHTLTDDVLAKVKLTPELLSVAYGNIRSTHATHPEWYLEPEQAPLLNRLGQILHQAVLDALSSRKRQHNQISTTKSQQQQDEDDFLQSLQLKRRCLTNDAKTLRKEPTSSHSNDLAVINRNNANRALLNMIQSHIDRDSVFPSYEMAFKRLSQESPPSLQHLTYKGLLFRFKHLVDIHFENAVEISKRLDQMINRQPIFRWTDEMNIMLFDIIKTEIDRIQQLPPSQWPRLTAKYRFFGHVQSCFQTSPIPSLTSLIRHFDDLVKVNFKNARQLEQLISTLISTALPVEQTKHPKQWTPELKETILDIMEKTIQTNNVKFPCMLDFFRVIHPDVSRIVDYKTPENIQTVFAHLVQQDKNPRAIKLREVLESRTLKHLNYTAPTSQAYGFYANRHKCHRCQHVYNHDDIGQYYGLRPLYGDVWATLTCGACTSQEYGRPTVALFVHPTQRPWADIAMIVLFNLALSNLNHQDAFYDLSKSVTTFVNHHFDQLCIGHDPSDWQIHFMNTLVQNPSLFEPNPQQQSNKPNMIRWRLVSKALQEMQQIVDF